MVRIVVFRARIECIECGGVVFLDGPVRHATCVGCKSTNTVPDDWWEIIKEGDEDYESRLPPTGLRHGSIKKGVTLVYSRGRAKAIACSGCEAPLDLSTFQWGVDRAAVCQACGAETAALVPPAWLRPFAGRAQAIFGALAEGADLESSSIAVAGAKPVAMACLNCGGSLTITSEHDRVTQCEYCSSDYYVPDAIWFHLHGTRRRRPWFVMYWDAQTA